MTTHDVVEKYQARLNKSDSQDYDNLWWYQIEETFYKGMLSVIRRMKKGINAKREPDESTSDSIDDLQILLKTQSLGVTNRDVYALTVKLPTDYLYYKRLSPKCTKGNCETSLKSYFREEANVDDLLNDYMHQPSFDFEQTFHTLSGNKFKIYHNKDFEIVEAQLVYYRMPKKYTFTRDQAYQIEFKDDVVELFIDEGIKIMATDIADYSTSQVIQQKQATE